MYDELTVFEAKRLGVTTCAENSSLETAARLMVEEDISSLVVTDGAGWLKGLLSRTDLVRAACCDDGWAAKRVGDCMSRQVVTVSADTLLRDAARLLQEHHIHRVVVVEPGKEEGQIRPIGVLSASDVLYHLVRP
jgi:CBS domain-containing protein